MDGQARPLIEMQGRISKEVYFMGNEKLHSTVRLLNKGSKVAKSEVQKREAPYYRNI